MVKKLPEIMNKIHESCVKEKKSRLKRNESFANRKNHVKMRINDSCKKKKTSHQN